jgi:tRNA (guanine-N7-)-methyltransferase
MDHDLVLPLNRIDPPLDLMAVFGTPGPVEVEIGIGKGLFLLEEARRREEGRFLGIEVSTKYVKWTLERLCREGIRNVRLVREEASYFVDRYLPPGSVAVYHVYYPDPWPKRRHRKRRLFRPSFAAAIGRSLAADGELRVATDHGEYFEQIRGVLAAEPLLAPMDEDPGAWSDWKTNFARKYEKEDRGVFRARYRRARESRRDGGAHGFARRGSKARGGEAPLDV